MALWPAQYSSAVLSLVPAALATDVFTLTGSATKTVNAIRLTLSGTQTTLGTVALQIVKRSSANTGGTFTTPAVVSHDSGNAVGTAVVRAYTANPTALGTLVGPVLTAREVVAGATSVTDSRLVTYDLHPMVLRGTGELLALNFNGATVTGGNFALVWSWSEE